MDCQWSVWSKSGECTKSCGERKIIVTPQNGGQSCAGDPSKSEICNNYDCPRPGKISKKSFTSYAYMIGNDLYLKCYIMNYDCDDQYVICLEGSILLQNTTLNLLEYRTSSVICIIIK